MSFAPRKSIDDGFRQQRIPVGRLPSTGMSSPGAGRVSTEYPELYRDGLRLFNEEDFFECHEVFEELWSESQGEQKRFLQGLIQAAVALFHFGNENFGGAKKLYISATQKLDPIGQQYMGIDLAGFLSDFRVCFQELLDNTEAYPTTVFIRDELVPKIRAVEEGLIQ